MAKGRHKQQQQEQILVGSTITRAGHPQQVKIVRIHKTLCFRDVRIFSPISAIALIRTSKKPVSGCNRQQYSPGSL
jgi:hypothetical protein